MNSAIITVVGVGALGSHFVQFARNIKESICAIDFDRVQAKNCDSQFHGRMHLGRNKAQALQQVAQGMFGLRIEAIPRRLTSDNVAVLLSDMHLVVDSTDNAATRNLIQTFCREHNTPCVHGALSADGTFARVVWSEHFKSDQEEPGAATCENGEHLPFIALVAAHLAGVVQDFLLKGEKRSVQITPYGVVRIA